MSGLLDYLSLGDRSGGGLFGNLFAQQQEQGPGQPDFLSKLGTGISNAAENPLFAAGLGLLSGQNLQGGLGNALTALQKAKKDADQKAIYSQFLQSLGGMTGGAPPPVAGGMMPSGPPPPMPPPGGAPGPANAPAMAFPGPADGPAPPRAPVGPTSKVWGDQEAVDAGLYPPAPGGRPSPAPPAPTGAMPGPGPGVPGAVPGSGPPPLTSNPSSASLTRMIAIMAHPELPEGPRKAIELMVGKALDDNKLTNEQKNYVAYYTQTKATGEVPVTFDKFMAMPRHAPTMTKVYGANGLEQYGSFDPMKEKFTPIGGQQMAPVETKRQEAVGGAQGTAQAMLPVGLENSAFALKAIDDVQNHPGKSWGTGMTALSTRFPGTKAYDFGVALDQLKGKVFGDAFDSLRGAGAITEKEGEKATVAKARLDNAQTEGAFNSALQDLKEVFQSGQNRMLLKAGLNRKDVAPIIEQTGPKPAVPGDQGYRTNSGIIGEARKAIAAGKDPEAVRARLKQFGVDPAGL